MFDMLGFRQTMRLFTWLKVNRTEQDMESYWTKHKKLCEKLTKVTNPIMKHNQTSQMIKVGVD